MHPQQSSPQLPDSGSAGLSSKRLQIVQYSGLLLFVIIPLSKRTVLADCCRGLTFARIEFEQAKAIQQWRDSLDHHDLRRQNPKG